MNKAKNKSLLVLRAQTRQAGFTLAEIVVVIGIIVLIFGIVLASVNSSKDKAADAETKKVISELALKAEGKDIAPGVMDYQAAFTSINADSALRELAAKYQVADGEYQYIVTPNNYAIVFPLKKGNYYCIDSESRGSAIEIPTLFIDRGPQTCYGVAGLALGGGGGGGGGSSITINLPSSSDYCGDRAYCTEVYSESGVSTAIARGGFMDKMKDLLAQAVGAIEEDSGGLGGSGPILDDGGGVGVELPPADSGTISVGVSIGIDPDRQGSLLSEYLGRNITATDAEGKDITGLIEIQEFNPGFLKSISDGPDYNFSKSASSFPSRYSGNFTQCGSPYAIKYTVSDGNGNTASKIQEYMTCAEVSFPAGGPLR